MSGNKVNFLLKEIGILGEHFMSNTDLLIQFALSTLISVGRNQCGDPACNCWVPRREERCITFF